MVEQSLQGDEPTLDEHRVLMERVRDHAILFLDAHGSVQRWSAGAERLLGFTAAEVRGRIFHFIFTAHDREKEQPEFEMREAVEKGRCEDERWHVRKDGSQFWASGVLTAIRDDRGQLSGFVKILRDITERKRFEDRLTEANQRKDEFLALLAHELRNPLAAIVSAAHLLSMMDDSEIKNVAQIIERQSAQLTSMMADLSDVSRIQTGKLVLNRQRVTVRALIEQALESTRGLIDSKRHEVSVELPERELWLDVDPARMSQALANLLSNAAKYTEPGGHIQVSGRREGPQVIVSVVDNGIGIMSEMVPRVFELFTQADRSLDRTQGGLGIGLNLVKRLVEMHGGQVRVHSEGIGLGSEFEIKLPASGEPLVRHVSHRQGEHLRTERKILIVDDNPDTLTGLAMLLETIGQQVTIARTGPEAIEAALRVIPDVILLDLALPGMDGLQVITVLRSHAELAETAIVAMTGYGSLTDRQRSLDAGFREHLVKPITFPQLVAVLRDLEEL